MITNLILIVFVAAIGCFLVLAVLLWFFQHRLIYNPTPYHPTYRASLPERTRELEFLTTAGRQLAFFVPSGSPSPDPEKIPRRLWVLLGGNSSVALNWIGWVRESPDPEAAFLLVDYPGYGCCEGSPSPEGILANCEGAFDALARELGVPADTLAGRTSVLGHSLGAAAALQFAARHPVRRVVLVAPFTSMRDMARRVVGRPLAWLLRHSFENEARLRELAARPDPPRVTILHGTADNVVPVEMGRRLAAAFPRMVDYLELPGADHVTVLDSVRRQLAPPPE